MKLIISSAISSFDAHLTALVQKLPAAVGPVMITATTVGQPAVGLAALGAIGVFAFATNRLRLGSAVGFVLLASSMVSLTKLLVHRPRPDTLYVATNHPHGHSFPSGHAADAMMVYGLLAYLAVKYLPAPWSLVIPVLCGIWIFVVGLSRVWLGAHFPTDVLGGWLVGAVVVMLIIYLLQP